MIFFFRSEVGEGGRSLRRGLWGGVRWGGRVGQSERDDNLLRAHGRGDSAFLL